LLSKRVRFAPRAHRHVLYGKAPNVGLHRLFAILTTEPNATVAPIHDKAMPVL
jgi:putative SOS response-associated peptidase YedK